MLRNLEKLSTCRFMINFFWVEADPSSPIVSPAIHSQSWAKMILKLFDNFVVSHNATNKEVDKYLTTLSPICWVLTWCYSGMKLFLVLIPAFVLSIVDYDFLPSSALSAAGIPCRENICLKCKALLKQRKDLRDYPRLVKGCSKLWKVPNCCQLYQDDVVHGFTLRRECLSVPEDLNKTHIQNYFDRIVVDCPVVIIDSI